MQTMLIAVQNTVPAKDMGVATSSATFFRQLGGTLGVAVFLSLLFNSLPDKVQGALQSAAHDSRRSSRPSAAAAADPNSPSHAIAQNLVPAAQGNAGRRRRLSDALSTDSSFLNTLDRNIARPFQVGYVDSTHLVYIIGGIIMACAFAAGADDEGAAAAHQVGAATSGCRSRPTRTPRAPPSPWRTSRRGRRASRRTTTPRRPARRLTGSRSVDRRRMPWSVMRRSACRRLSQDRARRGRGRRDGHAVTGRHGAAAPDAPSARTTRRAPAPRPLGRGLISGLSWSRRVSAARAAMRGSGRSSCSGHRPAVDHARTARRGPRGRDRLRPRRPAAARARWWCPGRPRRAAPAPVPSSHRRAAGGAQQPADQRVGAERAVPDADAVLGRQRGGDHRRLLAGDGEGHHADAVHGAAEQRVHGDAGDLDRSPARSCSVSAASAAASAARSAVASSVARGGQRDRPGDVRRAGLVPVRQRLVAWSPRRSPTRWRRRRPGTAARPPASRRGRSARPRRTARTACGRTARRSPRPARRSRTAGAARAGRRPARSGRRGARATLASSATGHSSPVTLDAPVITSSAGPGGAAAQRVVDGVDRVRGWRRARAAGSSGAAVRPRAAARRGARSRTPPPWCGPAGSARAG